MGKKYFEPGGKQWRMCHVNTIHDTRCGEGRHNAGGVDDGQLLTVLLQGDVAAEFQEDFRIAIVRFCKAPPEL